MIIAARCAVALRVVQSRAAAPGAMFREGPPPLPFLRFVVLNSIGKLCRREHFFDYKSCYHYLGRGGVLSCNGCPECNLAVHCNCARYGKL